MIDKSEYILEKFAGCFPNGSGVIHTTCPFHDDNRPSFSIDVEEGLFICGSISCGVRGGFPLFYKLMENIDSWQEVWEDLKSTTTNFNINDVFDKSRPKKDVQISDFPAPGLLEPIGEVSYLKDRNIGSDIVEAFGLTYGASGQASEINIAGTIVCPIWDLDGGYKTFQVRYLNPKAKMRWCNPGGSPIQDLLYGGWLINDSKKTLWIVEGASDVWRLKTHGIQAVGLNTKEASSSQLNKLVKLCKYLGLKPVVCLDGDAAEANKKLFNEIVACGLDPLLIQLDPPEDPGALTVERVKEVWEDALDKEGNQ